MRRLFLGLSGVLIACSTSGGTEHGPVFGDASADGSSDAPSDAPIADASAVDSPVDSASGDAGEAGGCAATFAVVGGSGTSFFASIFGGGAWTTTRTADTLAAPAALVPFGAGFHLVAHEVDDSLRWSAFGATWSPTTPFAGIGARDVPALAAVGSTLHLVYQASGTVAVDYKYFHGQNSGAWDTALDPVTAGGNPSFGPNAPGAAAVGAKLVIAQVGDDAHVHAQTWDATWQASVDVTPNDAAPGIALKGVHPDIVALSGAASDAMIVFVRSGDDKLMSTTRGGAGWSVPAVVDALAYTTEPFSLLALPGGHAVVAWRGTDGKPYFSLFSGTGWSVPAQFLSPNPGVASAPALAPGACGADAIGALAVSGAVSVVGLSGAAWSAALPPVPSSSGATFVSVAVAP